MHVMGRILMLLARRSHAVMATTEVLLLAKATDRGLWSIVLLTPDVMALTLLAVSSL